MSKVAKKTFDGGDSMEKFLLDLTEGSGYHAELERRFSANPLPDENRKAITDYLSRFLSEWEFHAICKYYSIDVGPDPNSKSKRPNMRFYKRAMRRMIHPNDRCALYYLSLSPEEIHREVIALQSKLQEDFREYERQNYKLQWSLHCAKRAFRDLAGVDDVFLEDISTDRRSRRFLIEQRRLSEVCIFFRTSQLSPNEGEVLGVINSLVFANHCSGGDLKRLFRGEVRVYFNPTCHDYEDRKYVIKVVTEALAKPNPDASL